jgi:hypothetical protein
MPNLPRLFHASRFSRLSRLIDVNHCSLAPRSALVSQSFYPSRTLSSGIIDMRRALYPSRRLIRNALVRRQFYSSPLSPLHCNGSVSPESDRIFSSVCVSIFAVHLPPPSHIMICSDVSHVHVAFGSILPSLLPRDSSVS